MSRETIFEKLEKNIDLHYEIEKLHEIVKETLCFQIGSRRYDMEALFDERLFINWKHRGRAVSCDDFKTRIGVDKILENQNPSIFETLIYLEYLSNVLCVTSNAKNAAKDKTAINLIDKHFDSLANSLGYTIKYLPEDDRAMVIETSAAATAVADIISGNLSLKVLEYNHFQLKGNIERKREILLTLADSFEPRRSSLEKTMFKEIANDLGFLLNNMNIRHNNKEGKNRKEYTDSLTDMDLEVWYDKTYDILLITFLASDYLSIQNSIEKLKSNYGK